MSTHPMENRWSRRQFMRRAGGAAIALPTTGKPGVFATLDAGAAKTVGVYFMYDVKQFDPAEWSNPPLEGRLIDKAPFGKVVMGRGAVNQKGPETSFLAALHAFQQIVHGFPRPMAEIYPKATNTRLTAQDKSGCGVYSPFPDAILTRAPSLRTSCSHCTRRAASAGARSGR